MPGLVQGIRELGHGPKNVDGRDKPGHDERVGGSDRRTYLADGLSAEACASR